MPIRFDLLISGIIGGVIGIGIPKRKEATAKMQLPMFTKTDFTSTVTPYEYLRGLRNDSIQHEQAFAAIKGNAHAVGIRNFEKMYECYEESLAAWLVSQQ